MKAHKSHTVSWEQRIGFITACTNMSSVPEPKQLKPKPEDQAEVCICCQMDKLKKGVSNERI